MAGGGQGRQNGLQDAGVIQRTLFWLVWNVRLGPLAPWVLGMALGRMPKRSNGLE